jgi:hypothetical protein
MITSALRRAVLAIVLTGLAWSLAGVGQAFAGMPWWHLTTLSAPAKEAGECTAPALSGCAQIIVEASDLGDGVANELNSAITVKDKLPSGVRAVKVTGEGNGDSREGPLQENTVACSLEPEPKVVACAFPRRVGPYERLMLIIDVKVARGAGDRVNQTSVSGGFARPVVSSRTLALEGPPPPFGVQSYELTPEEEGGAPYTQAGGHPFQLTSTLILNTQAESKTNGAGEHRREAVPLALTKDLRFNLPPGLVGNPTPLPKCSIYVFSEQVKMVPGFKCPDDTVVGVASTAVDLACCLLHGPLVLSTPLYSLEPAVGEPARFGFTTPVQTAVILDTAVRTGGDYGVVVSVSNITQAGAVLGSQVTFWGAPSDHRHDSQRGGNCLDRIAEPKLANGGEVFCPLAESEQPFLIMPTSCAGAPRTSVEGDSWSEPGIKPLAEYEFQNSEGEPLPFDGCDKLNFEPSISVTPDGQQGSTPTGLTVGVHVPQEASLNPTGLAQSAVKSITVALPEGVAVDASGADGLQVCSEAQIALNSPAEQTCPEAAKVATVEIRTPLLPNPLAGEVYLAAQNANPFGSLIAMYLVAKDPVSGVLVKLAGKVSLSETGQIVSTFENPPLPFEDAELHFFGGSRAPLGTPASCGAYQASASVMPWAENGVVQLSSQPFLITTGPNGSPCQNPLAFAPSLTAGSLNLQAGAFTPFTTTMSRADGQQNLQGIQLHMPPGLSGLLTGVKLCGEAEGNAGTCGPESLIGETTVSVGLGGSPFSVKGGRVYITGPYQGAPFGLSIVNPAKAGPFDVERDTSNPNNQPPCDCVVVRARIQVDPKTAELTITTDNTGPYKIPTILDGIPLEIQHVNVTITRPGFTFNPTNCNPMAITGSLQSTQGATRALSVPFQVTNCATLKFAPKFAVSTSGKTSKANGASLSVKLTYPTAPFGTLANIKQVKVDLPKQLPSRLTTLQKACTAAQFEANPAGCPAASFIGHARALTPLIPVPLEGPAIFVSHGGEAFPSLEVVLQGYGVTIDLVGSTFISKAGITSSTFKTVPDAPVGSFELTLPEGPYSALAANGNLCSATKTVTVKKKVTVRVKGHKKTVTRKVKETVAGSLTMPTEFVGQNGAVIHQSTAISVTGCGKSKPAKKKAKK